MIDCGACASSGRVGKAFCECPIGRTLGLLDSVKHLVPAPAWHEGRNAYVVELGRGAYGGVWECEGATPGEATLRARVEVLHLLARDAAGRAPRE